MAYSMDEITSGLGDWVRDRYSPQTGGGQSYNEFESEFDLAALEEMLGISEGKALSKELLDKAIGSIEPYQDHWSHDFQRDMLGRTEGYLNAGEQGLEQLLDPNSALAQSQASRVLTGAGEGMRALAQNAAAGGIAQSQSTLTDLIGDTYQQLATQPVANLLESGNYANMLSQMALNANQGAATAFSTAYTPARDISSIYAGTNVETPLLGPGLQAMYGAAFAGGNTFPQGAWSSSLQGGNNSTLRDFL